MGLVILDEFHERSLQADLALALLLDVQQGLRDDLKLLIMSATLDNDRLQRLLPEAPVVVSEGRAYPVERRFSPLSAHQRFDEAVAVAAAELLRHEQDRCCCSARRRRDPARSGTADGARGGGCHSLPAVWRVALKRTAQSDPPGAGREAQSGAGHQYCRDQFDHRGIRLVVDSAQERVARFDRAPA
ncbi:ATP-dependent helicase HrpB [Klebsiella pneumoniae]|uniref:ATP-dependent helicase HrpB n=1 Tax=Klebsiella pneumoniae TaxID=573 RepID=A0A377UTV8_KLEPN|nr:ATP-dependent helicase HrpB [Klebsiella pneumoniae]